MQPNPSSFKTAHSVSSLTIVLSNICQDHEVPDIAGSVVIEDIVTRLSPFLSEILRLLYGFRRFSASFTKVFRSIV